MLIGFPMQMTGSSDQLNIKPTNEMLACRTGIGSIFQFYLLLFLSSLMKMMIILIVMRMNDIE